MPSGLAFRATLTSLWFRLSVLAIVSLIFAEALILASGKAQGWAFYLSIPEVLFEVLVRIIAAALVGLGLGTACSAVVAPFLWYFESSRQRLADRLVEVAAILSIFLVSRYVLEVMIKWAHFLSIRSDRFKIALFAAHFLTFVAVLCIPRTRKEMVAGLDGFLTPRMTRRTALATVGGAAALVGTQFVLSRSVPMVRAALTPERRKSNFLLITFDALNAEDMSLYGRSLPTTPNIDAFARKGTVFTNYYSASTFTTPSIATMMMGLYPSESRIYQLQGQVPRDRAVQTLPHLMRQGGYAVGAFLSNPFAYYFGKSIDTEFDLLPEPVFQRGGLDNLWKLSAPLHQNSGIGCRIDEYIDLESFWSFLSQSPANLSMRYRPIASFEQARLILDNLPDGFFLWIHLITPHNPYLPDTEDRGRFLSDTDIRTYEEEGGNRWKPHYPADQQEFVDQRRLRYDEFIATADRAFGAFMSDLENSGRLRNTTVMFSADHGESFEGGVYEHSSPYLTRPVTHIPLIIRTPDQQENRTVFYTADETALAPTILELAGLPAPDWMRGQSLVPWLNRDRQGKGEGLAFTQYLETNSVFKPIEHGTVGVIDGEFQYVYYLDSKKGELRPLSDAQIWNIDRAAEYPDRARALRAAIHTRFPDVA